MPVNIIATGAIPHYPGAPNRNMHGDAQNVINQLDYASIWRGPGTLAQNAQMRLDMQGVIIGPPQMQNLQVQINGIRGNSTVAHANISTSLQTHDDANQRGVVKKVISALQQSLDTGQSFLVTGSIP